MNKSDLKSVSQYLMLFFFIVLLLPLTHAQQAMEDSYLWPEDTLVANKLRNWQALKFGMIVHWGAYSEWGIVESWSLCPEDEPWCERKGPFKEYYHQYVEAYQRIPESFYPSAFDPDIWARAAKNAGMKYVVFTTKHHDGFSMFDTKYSDYKITGSKSAFASHPKSNVVREVFESFRSQGMAIGAYFSKADWNHEDYWWPYFPALDRNVNYDPKKYPEKWESFKRFTYNQIEELMTEYGSVDLLWLDGGWVRPEGSLTSETRPWLGKNQWIQDVDMPSIANMARKHQPGLLIVDRTVHGIYENYRTPEQQIPLQKPDYPWESCITLGDSWYSTGSAETYKSSRWAIHTLIKIISKGGNLLLGVGPDKTGAFVPEVLQVLNEIGSWIKSNGSAIYGTDPLWPYEYGNMYFTQKADQKKHFIFYLMEEGQSIPNQIELPTNFATEAFQAELLGYDKSVMIIMDKHSKKLSIPNEVQEEFADSPALVFVVVE